MIPRATEKMQRLVHWCRDRLTPSAIILLYHRIIELPTDPYLLSVSPQHFVEHLAVLRKEGQVTSLRQLVSGLRARRIPQRAIVITFDDGYFDNVDHAKPLLEQSDTPATVFVTPGSTADAHEFWWDALDRILLQVGPLPQTLRLIIHGVPHEWKLGSAAEYSPDDYARYRSWNYGRKDDPTPRQAIFRSIHRLLNPLSERERWNALRAMAAWAGIDTAVRASHRTLSSAEMVRLAEGGLLEVGAHTMTHPVLSKLPVPKQRDEVRQSKAHLEEILGQPVNSFAFPHGLKSDYTQETIAIVREAGFDCACAAFPGIVRGGADAHQLPRFVVRDDDGDMLAERLRTYFRD
jgi:peptidoglycan/xylan/chitin deacetylase (PgdA/CDA1 family)